MLILDFYNQTPTPVAQNLFSRLLKKTYTILSRKRIIPKHEFLSLELNIIGQKKMVLLNKKYHGKNKSTDVIAISFFDKKMKDTFIGEIFICLPYAKKQAKQIGQSLQEELKFLFIHGLLHLFGFDHKKRAQQLRMKQFTYAILERGENRML